MLEAIALTKTYGNHLALDQLDLAVRAGEVLCLLGANGAGKTTTINLFLGFIRPSSGSARVGGLEVAEHGLETKRLLAYVPEQVNLYGNLSGLENLAYFASLSRSGEEPPADELLACLDRVGLPANLAHRRVSTYSKGMRQKVGLAIALAKKAKALLLDEPTSGLDPYAANELSRLVRNLADDGVAVLMATHDLFRAREVGDRVGIMQQGRMVSNLATAGLRDNDLERIYLETLHPETWSQAS